MPDNKVHEIEDVELRHIPELQINSERRLSSTPSGDLNYIDERKKKRRKNNNRSAEIMDSDQPIRVPLLQNHTCNKMADPLRRESDSEEEAETEDEYTSLPTSTPVNKPSIAVAPASTSPAICPHPAWRRPEDALTSAEDGLPKKFKDMPAGLPPGGLAELRRRRQSKVPFSQRFSLPTGITNFHLSLIIGITGFFIFWILLLLRIYLPSSLFL